MMAPGIPQITIRGTVTTEHNKPRQKKKMAPMITHKHFNLPVFLLMRLCSIKAIQPAVHINGVARIMKIGASSINSNNLPILTTNWPKKEFPNLPYVHPNGFIGLK